MHASSSGHRLVRLMAARQDRLRDFPTSAMLGAVCTLPDDKEGMQDYIVALKKIAPFEANTQKIARLFRIKFDSFEQFEFLVRIACNELEGPLSTPVMEAFKKNVWAAVVKTCPEESTKAATKRALQACERAQGLNSEGSTAKLQALDFLRQFMVERYHKPFHTDRMDLVSVLNAVLDGGLPLFAHETQFAGLKSGLLSAILRFLRPVLWKGQVERLFIERVFPTMNLTAFLARYPIEEIEQILLVWNQSNREELWEAFANNLSVDQLNATIQFFIDKGLPHCPCAYSLRCKRRALTRMFTSWHAR